MDTGKYIESGVLEEYCLGLLSEEEEAHLIQMTMLYPDIKAELTAIENAMEKLANLNAIEPNPSVKQKVLLALGFDDPGMLNMDDLPVIRHACDPEPWISLFSHLIPDEPVADFVSHLIRDDEDVQQMLVISKVNVPEEEHGDMLESFFILQGRCECTIGEDFYALGPGDFVEIPLHKKHDIKLVTSHVTAVLQYRFI
ncbi:cupin domain-containing protein [Mucilaginibacter gotjawali]|uniref:Mannose-6-phosphate isomerase-like protein (Cupin superfamily) n=1 Tax=Mucilaginibacter gotjawali TaxID=1550579 RepID=A0A839SCL8_9SPHI|nr:cupin domain-containing protein [Mucilaginibacter gotjawali]MBB3055062.1 mannose-6-phosphate isomerase-like protein (cupin superfamily) [Mucilaginibacter gotjawali]